jgi:L-lactate dehydrogenase complex protein LldG
MGSRSEILAAIRHAADRGTRKGPVRTEPLVAGMDPLDAARRWKEAEAGRASARDALAEAFARECQALSVKVHRVRSHKAAADLLGSIILDRGIQKILHWRTPLLDRLGIPELIGRMGIEAMESGEAGSGAPNKGFAPADAQLGITEADYGLADSGTLVIRHGPERDRTPSVLPPVHVAVLEKDRILAGLDTLIIRLRLDLEEGKEPDRCVTLISGPSKTADIGISLVLGIHGPGEVHVILLELP